MYTCMQHDMRLHRCLVLAALKRTGKGSCEKGNLLFFWYEPILVKILVFCRFLKIQPRNWTFLNYHIRHRKASHFGPTTEKCTVKLNFLLTYQNKLQVFFISYISCQIKRLFMESPTHGAVVHLGVFRQLRLGRKSQEAVTAVTSKCTSSCEKIQL